MITFAKFNFEILFELKRHKAERAYIWLITLGLIGAHWFYLGNTKQAVIRILLLLTVIGAIVALIVDCFTLHTAVEIENQKMYNDLNKKMAHKYDSHIRMRYTTND